jgi:hypothetical protein
MASHHHEFDALSELSEVVALRCAKLVPAEERNNCLHQRQSRIHDELTEVLSMVVVPPIEKDPADPEELVELLEAANATLALRHGEPMSHLIAGSVALSASSARLPYEADGEATFSIYKTDYPTTLLDQSFLLIVRTRHVVTIVNVASDVTDE